MKIFISYSHLDKNLAKKIKKELEEYGLNFWIDEVDINLGDSLVEKISNGIDECDFLIAIISSNSISYKWVNKELLWAVDKEIKNPAFKVMPVVIDNSKLPNFLNDKLFFKTSRTVDIETLVKKIVKSIITSSNTNSDRNDYIKFDQFNTIKTGKRNIMIAGFYISFSVALIIFGFVMNQPENVIIVGLVLLLLGFAVITVSQRSEKILKDDRALLKRIDNIGPFLLAFDYKWQLQYKASKSNKKYRYIILYETVISVLIIEFSIKRVKKVLVLDYVLKTRDLHNISVKL